MIITKKTRLQLQIQKIIFVILILFIAGLLAWISQQHSIQFDWTNNKRNTLSQGSIDLLRTMQSPIIVNVYVQDDATVKAAIEEILSRYQREKADFNYKLINPDLDIEMAQQDNITQYGQIIIKYQGRVENISSLSEQTISSALLRLNRTDEAKLVFLSGHGERSPDDVKNTGYNKFAEQLISKGIVISTKNLIESELDADTTVLVIASPDHPILPGELAHIKTYIANGKNLLWMMDPGKLQGLDELASMLGIKFHDGIIVDNNINLRETLGIQHPAVIPVLDYYPHAITKNLSYNTLFPISRGIESIESADWHSSIIAQSLPQSWSEASGLKKALVFDTPSGDIAGPIPIVLALERNLAKTNEDPSSTKPTQRIIVAGDSDFLANNYLGVGANLKLGTNIINWLTQDDKLIAIDTKGSTDTQLQLTDNAILLIGFGFLVVLPAGLTITGLIIWFKRRRQ